MSFARFDTVSDCRRISESNGLRAALAEAALNGAQHLCRARKAVRRADSGEQPLGEFLIERKATREARARRPGHP